MNSRFLLGVVVAALGLLSVSVFIVDEREKVIKFRLGEIVRSDYTAGIYLQLPFVNNIRRFDARLQTMDAQPTRIITKEKKYVVVDAFVKWRIGDAEKFYTTMAGDIRQANRRLDPIVKRQLTQEFGKRTIQDLVSGDRETVMALLTDNVRQEVIKYGVEVVDMRVKRVDFEQDISENVFNRMRTERDRVARERRAKGRADGERIRADADREYTATLASAYSTAQTTRGDGDATAAAEYAAAYGKNKEFYSFYRSLGAYKSAFSSKNDVILLQPDSDFFKYFGSPKAKK
ncbi:MAG: protease modulator HflC [Sulfuriflexus sp.]|nr:protease modulator HflC [Sulfuriflexus sp.]